MWLICVGAAILTTVIVVSVLYLNSPAKGLSKMRVPDELRVTKWDDVFPVKKVLIGGVVRNIERNFSDLKHVMTKLLSEIPYAHLYVYENNSTDQSAELLKQWSNESFAKVTVQSEMLSREQMFEQTKARTYDGNPGRIELIRNARNKLLDMMPISQDAHELTVLIDLDVRSSFDITELVRLLRQFPKQVDALFANGTGGDDPVYYDRYALRCQESPLGPELIGEYFWSYISTHPLIIPRNASPVPVWSAFGGIGIYKSASIFGLRYSTEPERAVHALYEKIMSTSSGHDMVKEYYKMNGTKQTLQFCNNSGYDQPLTESHVNLHAAMIEKGYDQLFIWPSLVYDHA